MVQDLEIPDVDDAAEPPFKHPATERARDLAARVPLVMLFTPARSQGQFIHIHMSSPIHR